MTRYRGKGMHFTRMFCALGVEGYQGGNEQLTEIKSDKCIAFEVGIEGLTITCEHTTGI